MKVSFSQTWRFLIVIVRSSVRPALPKKTGLVARRLTTIIPPLETEMYALNFKKFLASSQYADVEFAVTPDQFPVSKTFKGHTQLLAMRNDVFGAMFYGKLVEKGTVVIKDLHPDGFYGLLKYLYTGKLKLTSIAEAMYTRSAAEKYLVPELVLACTEYIKKSLTVDEVCRLIDYTAVRDGGQIDAAVDLVLKRNSAAVLASEAFTDCLEATVHYVLDKVTNVPEVSVVHAVHRWAEAAREKGATASGKLTDLKTVMAPFLAKLRLLALTPKEFAKTVGAWGVIDKDEAFAILCILTTSESAAPPEWLCQDRTPR